MDALCRSDDILPTSYEPNSFVLRLKKFFDINDTEIKSFDKYKYNFPKLQCRIKL